MIRVDRHATYTIKIDKETRDSALEALQDWTASNELEVEKLMNDPKYDPTAPGLPRVWQHVRRLGDALRDVDQYDSIETSV
jgi:hypothetical protein